jgi:hypothetical protein
VTGMCSYVDLVGPWLVSWRDQFKTAQKTLPLRFAAATTGLRPASGFSYWGLLLTAVLALVRQAVRVIPPPEQDCSDGCWSPQ